MKFKVPSNAFRRDKIRTAYPDHPDPVGPKVGFGWKAHNALLHMSDAVRGAMRSIQDPPHSRS